MRRTDAAQESACWVFAVHGRGVTRSRGAPRVMATDRRRAARKRCSDVSQFVRALDGAMQIERMADGRVLVGPASRRSLIGRTTVRVAVSIAAALLCAF